MISELFLSQPTKGSVILQLCKPIKTKVIFHSQSMARFDEEVLSRLINRQLIKINTYT